jgi:cystine transport system permease protein
MIGMGTSVFRALVMLTIYIISKVIGRTYDILTAASIAAFLLLLDQPLYLLHTGFQFSFGAVLAIGILLPAFPAAVLCFSINEGAYMAESMRAALEAVPKGQLEAGYCVGMSYWQIMRRIILPQAFRTAFPSLSNSFISMVKSTSMASTITVSEMIRQTQIINGRVYQSFALYMEVGLVYLIFCTVLTWLQSYGEKKLSAYGGTR